MRLALILALTMLLLGCDNEAQFGSDAKWEFVAGYNDKNEKTGWLLNKETGELRICEAQTCSPVDMQDAPYGYNVIPESPRTAEEEAYRQELIKKILDDGEPDFTL